MIVRSGERGPAGWLSRGGARGNRECAEISRVTPRGHPSRRIGDATRAAHPDRLEFDQAGERPGMDCRFPPGLPLFPGAVGTITLAFGPAPIDGAACEDLLGWSAAVGSFPSAVPRGLAGQSSARARVERASARLW